jgi:hypothetical protein
MSANGIVYKRGDTWFHEVRDLSGKPVLMDNTGDWRVIFEECLKDVAVVRRIERAGHRLERSYPELVAAVVSA